MQIFVTFSSWLGDWFSLMNGLKINGIGFGWIQLAICVMGIMIISVIRRRQ